ncbi:hypothetical protein MBLNU459_g3744t2 [Dothideomycetes sp. NU459]
MNYPRSISTASESINPSSHTAATAHEPQKHQDPDVQSHLQSQAQSQSPSPSPSPSPAHSRSRSLPRPQPQSRHRLDQQSEPHSATGQANHQYRPNHHHQPQWQDPHTRYLLWSHDASLPPAPNSAPTSAPAHHASVAFDPTLTIEQVLASSDGAQAGYEETELEPDPAISPHSTGRWEQVTPPHPHPPPPPPGTGSLRKRRAAHDSVDLDPPATPTSEPVPKKPRPNSRPKHRLDRFTFAGPSINHLEPPSPLFFSNSPRPRPHLPPRFSSSEAGATMLSKANSEESRVKRVTLARGTVSTPSAPTSNPPLRRSLDRSSLPRSSSPDVVMGGEVTVSSLGSIGIIELLDQDERPTIIVDLGDSANYGTGPIRPLFANASMRSYHGLLDVVSGLAEHDASPDSPHAKSFVQFKSWLLSAAVNGESLNVCLPSFLFADMGWSCSTLRKRLRIISGTYSVGAAQRGSLSVPTTLSLPTRSAASASNPPTSAHSLLGPTIQEEPQDYFGSAAPPPQVEKSDKTSSGPASGEVLPSTEPIDNRDAGLADPGYPLVPASVATSSSAAISAASGSHASLVPGDVAPARPKANADWSNGSLVDMTEGPSFDWTRLSATDTMPPHIQFARNVDWASTALGPIESWSADLRQMCNLIMASPHPAAMYWGQELIAIYNEAYVLLAGQKHPKLMGQSYRDAWSEIWSEVEGVFANAVETGEATMKDDDRLFMLRNDYLEETYFSWSIIPMVGGDGSVMGLYNPAFEKTRRKLAERRMLTLREIGERTAAARDVKGFWDQVLGALELNEFDTPFVLLYSLSYEADSDTSSVHSSSVFGSKQCILEGSLGVPEGHQSAPPSIDFKAGNEGFGPVFREATRTDRPLLLEVGSRDLPAKLLEGLEWRGFGDPCRGVVVCPIQPTTGETVLGFLVMGVNPRRPYDEDYSLFVQLLSRQLATSLASVVLFEEEIRRGQKAAKLAALDRIELSEQLAARTQEAIDSETKFTRMAEFAPVGMFIASPEGRMTYCNNTWFEVSHVSRDEDSPTDRWMDAVQDEDRPLVDTLWHDLIVKKEPQTASFRFKSPWKDRNGVAGERWVLFSAYPEKYENGALKSVFGSLTDISKQKWAEDFQKRKMEQAVELKRQQENFIDITSHEMRNPLSAILQCADEIVTTMAQLRDDMDQSNLAATVNTTLARGRRVKESLEEIIASTVDSAQTIALCAQHQKRIVDDILTLSKLDSQLLLVTPVDVQPLTVAQRALKMHEGELQTADIQLKFVVDSSYAELDIDWVKFDPSRVLQVLINLTTNAIKFTTTESKRVITVTIGASIERPSKMENRVVNYFPTRNKRTDLFADKEWGDGEAVYIHFAVKDTGRGLDDQEKKMLFLRFSQASPRTHVQYGGSGLGLFISRELSELQGGEIGVASEAGVGSTFAFYVKAKRTSAPADSDGATHRSRLASNAKGTKLTTALNAGVRNTVDRASPAGSDRAGKVIKVLIVEDNLVNQRVLQKQLKNLGCTVHVANHGGEALDILRRSTWWNHEHDSDTKPSDRIQLSVVLMDQEMPVMDGLTCTKKIRELEKEGKFARHVPVIAVTANARSEQVQTALDAGMDDVVAKPFRIPELIPKIEELMEKYPE